MWRARAGLLVAICMISQHKYCHCTGTFLEGAHHGRKLKLTGARNTSSLMRRSFTPTTVLIPTFPPATASSDTPFLTGGSNSIVDPVSGITFIMDPGSGRFFPVDPITGRIVTPLPVIQQDPNTGQSFIVVNGSVITVDPVLGRPLSISGVSAVNRVTSNPVTVRIGGTTVRLPAIGVSKGSDNGDVMLRLGNVVYSDTSSNGKSFAFGG